MPEETIARTKKAGVRILRIPEETQKLLGKVRDYNENLEKKSKDISELLVTVAGTVKNVMPFQEGDESGLNIELSGKGPVRMLRFYGDGEIEQGSLVEATILKGEPRYLAKICEGMIINDLEHFYLIERDLRDVEYPGAIRVIKEDRKFYYTAKRNSIFPRNLQNPEKR